MVTLFIDRKGLTLRADGGVLTFYDQERRVGTVPVRVLERVCISGDLQLSASVLGKLGGQGVGVAVLGGRKRQPVLLMPNLKVDALRRMAQFNLAQNPDFCLQQAKIWIGGKVADQAALLERFAEKNSVLGARLHRSRSVLAQVVSRIGAAGDTAQLRGLEGAAAAHYFAAFPYILPDSLNFKGRNKRPPADAFNAVLSLGYTLLHFELVKQVYLTGLDPFVGFYHGIDHGRESLACDLIEPLRPLYDEWAVSLFADKVLRPEDFSIRGQACMMGKAGRMRFYAAFEKAARLWRPQMRRLCRDLLASLGVAAGKECDFAVSEIMIAEPEDALADCV
ncbi:CRISPR-associated endonuclease Cas1 [Neisseria leonii]|uniref:CRISPR-associated endonuclease Cas1 n=1 Tax=Neisseria leonii TaxID=2995413 RepID=UPI0030D49CA8